jgi:RNA polymerase sigma-70 factor (ECF subfamily)
VRRYQGRVVALARHYVGAEEARDVAQDVFVRIYGARRSFPEAERFLAWVIRVGRNVCIDWLRHRRRHPPARDLDVAEVELASPEPSPDEAWRASRREKVIEQALETMSGLNREVIVLREIQRLSVHDTASVLGIPAGTVKSRASRARLELARAVRSLIEGPGRTREETDRP